MKLWTFSAAVVLAFQLTQAAPFSTKGNRLTYLDSDDPFYVGRDFPKLITPQWVGEDGVDAVVVLAIDDMRNNEPKYETVLRPILERLKKIDGRAPVSIMVNQTSPTNQFVQKWLKEGVSLEVHSISHPCPLCQNGDFNSAFTNFHNCVDLLNTIPGNKPVAFRMPCCDSMNSPSPRFYSEIFNRTSPKGNFLSIDSSVMVILTTNDTSLPRELVMDADGRERFRKYLPSDATDSLSPQRGEGRGEGWEKQNASATANASASTTPHPNPLPVQGRGNQTRVSMGSFTTTIEDYPYPYVINKTCWEFPCIVPSDWEANNLHAPNNPKTVEDWERALDAIVLKQGVMTFIFHPHGWIKPEQMVEFIDYAVTKYGKRVKFLNFREAQERLNKNLLKGRFIRPEVSGVDAQGLPMSEEEKRIASTNASYWNVALRHQGGGDAGVRLLDINNDGYMDVITQPSNVLTRIWNPERKTWSENVSEILVSQFAIFDTNGSAGLWSDGGSTNPYIWIFDGTRWTKSMSTALRNGNESVPTDNGVRFRDLDHDGVCELIIGTPKVSAVFKYDFKSNEWRKLDYALPPGTSIVDDQGRDAGLRFIDVDGDGYDDILFSNSERYSLHLFRPDDRKLRLKPGWSDEIVSGVRAKNNVGGTSSASPKPNSDGDSRSSSLRDPIPPIVRDGTNRNNGVWFARSTMWIQNEDTAHLPDKVDRRTFKQLLSSGQPRAMSPDESLPAMHVQPGFKVELVASEPFIQSPVAFEWSADGKLWVVEMGDYPLGIDGKGKGGGRVRVLEDTDGDGKYDKAATFLEGLNFPNGIYPWRNGAVISAAPEIFYAEDTDGDGKADVREVLFTGFTPGNQQHRANGFDYGLDGWLYGANGDSGGNVQAAGTTISLSPQRGEGRGEGWERAGVSKNASATSGTTPHPNPLPVEGRGDQKRVTLNLRGHDFRIQPDKRLIETVEGQTQFGRHRDDFGNWFGNNNPTWLWHYYFPEHYLARNPYLPLKTTKKLLANYDQSTRCFPASRMLSRFNDPFALGHVTSGNSATPYRDDLFGKDFATSVFISEPVHNLVHREVLEPDGVSFTSHRASDETTNEFLASEDNWFRPTQLKTGPDGALYIADMYRLVIEHPEWIPKEMQARLDLRAGADMGRIYRVYPEGATLRKIPNLAKLSSSELVNALNSSSGWQRDTAQRLLIERGDKSVTKQVESLAKSAKSAKVRAQALWTLYGLGALSEESVAGALRDKHAAVREHAIKLVEPFAARAAARNAPLSSSIADTLVSLAGDSKPRVRCQLAFTLGEWSEDRASKVILKLAGDRDENIRNAALSSAPRHAKAVLALARESTNNDFVRSMLPMLEKLVAKPPALAQPTTIIERTSTIPPEQRAERTAVVARYAEVKTLKGNSRNGADLFKQQCAQCHRVRGEGADIGPDLGIMSGKPVEQLVEAILDPNAAFEERFRSFSLTTRDGSDLSGIIVAETPTTLTLRAPNQPEQTILRADLKEITASGLSLMPEGFENAFTPQQLADVIAFVLGR